MSFNETTILYDDIESLVLGVAGPADPAVGNTSTLFNYLRLLYNNNEDFKNNMNSLIGPAYPSAPGTNTVMNYLKRLDDSIYSSMLSAKSVQRGIFIPSSAVNTISISYVNPTKSLVLLQGTLRDSSDREANPYPGSFNGSSFEVIASILPNGSSSLSWQVIEFY